jgi:hydroxymethylglutaryl-CoA lyase
MAVGNVMASLDYGIRVFDAAIGGLGGCPYAPGARGNVDTRAVYDMLTAAGWQTGLDGDALAAADMVMKTIASGLSAAAEPEGQT